MSAAEDISLSVDRLYELLAPECRSLVKLDELANLKASVETGKGQLGLGAELPPEQVLNSFLQGRATNVIQIDGLFLEEELNTAALMKVAPDRFMNDPLKSILAPPLSGGEQGDDYPSYCQSFSYAKDKGEILKQLELFAQEEIKSGSLISDILAAADEMITNAVFNAPFVSTDNNFRGKSRETKDIGMGDGKEGRFFAGRKDKRIVFGCHDPFGSLRVEPVLSRVQSCFEQGVAENMNMGLGGAGIGTFLVFNSSTSMYMGVNKEKATIVACAMPTNMSGNKRSQVSKNLHVFQSEGVTDESV